MNILNLRNSAIVLALCAAIVSGVNSVVTKNALTLVGDPLLYTILKNAVVALLLLGILVTLRRLPELRALSRTNRIRLGAIGLVGGSIPFALYFTGLAMTSAVNAALIHKTLVLWVLLFSYPFLKERLHPALLFGIVAIFVGNLFLGGFSGFAFSTGEFLILLATLLWAVEQIIAKKALAEVSTLLVVSARMVLGSVVLIAYFLFRGTPFALGALSLEAWGWTLFTSLLLFGFVTLWFSALRRAPASVVAALLVPATLITNLITVVVTDRTLTPVQALGGIGVFLGLVWLIVSLYALNKKRTHPTPSLSGI